MELSKHPLRRVLGLLGNLVMKNDRYQYDTGDQVIGQPAENKHHHAFHEQCTNHPSAPAFPYYDVMA